MTRSPVHVPALPRGERAAADERTEYAKLGRILIRRGLVTAAQLDVALAEQERERRPLGRILIERRIIGEADLVAALAAQIGLEYVDLDDHPVDPTAACTVPEALARRHRALPIRWDGRVLVVAMADPSNVLAMDDLRSVAGADVRPVVATAQAIEAAIGRAHQADGAAAGITALAAAEEDDAEELTSVREVVEDGPIVKLANLLITRAVQDRASDIHVEPAESDLRVRYRIDGVLHEVLRPPKQVQAGLVSRLKIMADLNIAEKRVPQDGRVSAEIGGRQVDLRVATLPTVHGEKIVMRVLDKGTAMLDLADLGFLPETMARYETTFRKPYGTILVTGPTGSGKSTTLYATLNQLNDPAKNIITVEDPVEYRLPGINQVQVNAKAGLTFAAALRSILRSDPDIVLVGEIRDRETATIAMEAALTGHLVLSTLHTNDAASTPTRMVEMGLEPYLVSSALDCIVAQRLARRLCERCKQPYQASEADLAAVGRQTGGRDLPRTLHRAAGCRACGGTGYRGRLALHEVLLLTEELRGLVAERAHSEEIRRTGVAQGMLTLRQAGLAHVAEGRTSLEELLRVVA